MRATAIVLAAGVLAALASVSPAIAAGCGGQIPCQCGDTVQSSTTLAADLGVCAGVGLRVVSGVALDCDNHTITGNDSGATYGVLIDTAVGAEVKNCRVTGFHRGIRVDGGQGNRVTTNEAFENDNYGIELAGGSLGSVVSGNLVYRNRDEGIHVGEGAHNTVVRENIATKNKNENIYVLGSNGCQVIMNTVSQTESAGIFIKHSRSAYVAQNTVINGPIHVRGNSVGNRFEANNLRGNGYFFEAFEEPPGTWTYPHQNAVIGGMVENTTTCLRFAGAFHNTVNELKLDNECEVTMWPLGGRDAINQINTLPLP
jgi:parallel beta-helix repeat protein